MNSGALIDVILGGAVVLAMGIAYLFIQHNAVHRRREERIARVKATAMRGGGASAGIAATRLRRQQKHDRLPFFTRMVAQLSVIERLQRRFDFAGIKASPENYLLLCCIATVSIACAIIFLGKPPLTACLGGFILGFGGPHFHVSRQVNKRKKRFLKLFPDGIDLIVRGLRAGVPVAKSMQTVAEELGPPVGTVFNELVEQVALGMNLEEAMALMAKRLGLTEFNFFVTSIILQRETGGNLAEILANLSEVLRQRQMMRLKIKAMSSEARASSAIVGSLPFLVGGALLVISPGYLDPLIDDTRGNLAGLYAICSMSFGIFIMTKLSNFEI